MANSESPSSGWKLESGEARHEAHPKTFQIPPRHVRKGLRLGDAAQLLFVFATGDVERMWVVVIGGGGESYSGALANTPAFVEQADGPIWKGDRVVFGPEHVIDATEPPLDSIEEEYGAKFARQVRRVRGLR